MIKFRVKKANDTKGVHDQQKRKTSAVRKKDPKKIVLQTVWRWRPMNRPVAYVLMCARAHPTTQGVMDDDSNGHFTI